MINQSSIGQRYVSQTLYRVAPKQSFGIGVDRCLEVGWVPDILQQQMKYHENYGLERCLV